MSAQNELFKRLYGRPEPTDQDMFAELYTAVPPEEFTDWLKKIADVANERTRELREHRDEVRRAYTKTCLAFDLCWREAWAQARAEMVLEDIK